MSKVFFANLRSRTDRSNKISKLKNLFDKAGFSEIMNKDDLTAIKMTFLRYFSKSISSMNRSKTSTGSQISR